MHLMRLVLPAMRRKRRGRIVNVSSVAGMMAMPTMAIYSASKWAAASCRAGCTTGCSIAACRG